MYWTTQFTATHVVYFKQVGLLTVKFGGQESATVNTYRTF